MVMVVVHGFSQQPHNPVVIDTIVRRRTTTTRTTTTMRMLSWRSMQQVTLPYHVRRNGRKYHDSQQQEQQEQEKSLALYALQASTTTENEDESSSFLSLSSSSSSSSSSFIKKKTTNDDNNNKNKNETLGILLSRAMITAFSCVTTWSFIRFGGLSNIRAFGIHTMIASVLLRSKSLAAASMAGSFSGMTGLLLTSSTTTAATAAATRVVIVHDLCNIILLGIWTGIALYFGEWRREKIHQPGIGGRLGVMAVMGHFAYLAVHNNHHIDNSNHIGLLRQLGIDCFQRLQGPYTILALVLASCVLQWSRHVDIEPKQNDDESNITLPSPQQEQEQQERSTVPKQLNLVKSRTMAKEEEESNDLTVTASTIPQQQQQRRRRQQRLPTIASLTSKAAILCFLLSCLTSLIFSTQCHVGTTIFIGYICWCLFGIPIFFFFSSRWWW